MAEKEWNEKIKFADDLKEDDTMDDDEDKRSAYRNMPANKRLTMKYDMGVLKKIGELEDELREKLGNIFDCDPDELPVDLDLNDICALEPAERKQALTELLKPAKGDNSALINETIEKLNKL